MKDKKDYYITFMPRYYLGMNISNLEAYAVNIAKIQKEIDKLFAIPKEYLNG